MKQDRINAFLDGNTFVHYSTSKEKLIIGNSTGLLKVFDVTQPDLEPISIDINENITSLANYNDRLVLTNTAGNLELVNLSKNEYLGSLYRSELPLRDSIFINEGKRILSGGDDNKLIIIDLENGNKITTVSLPDQLLNISYNDTGELLALSLSNEDIQLYSVVNEEPNLIKTFNKRLSSKINTSMDKIDFNDEHSEELISTKTQWTSNGRYLLVPNESLQVFDRSNWTDPIKSFNIEGKIIDYDLSPTNKEVGILTEKTLTIFDFNTTKKITQHQIPDLDGNFPLNFVWRDLDIYIGTTLGEVVVFKDIIDETSEINSLFVDEAEEVEGNDTDDLLHDSDEEVKSEFKEPGYKLHVEDSMVIDEDDVTYSDRKRHKPNGFTIKSTTITQNHQPYSPGSTPWHLENKDRSTTSRRYLSMTSIGYVWAVKTITHENTIDQQSITVSFFDRSVHKDYHFIDYDKYDLCSINDKGILLASSGFQDMKSIDNGKIYYRKHDSEQDAWERKIPLLKNEYITSISITNESKYDANAVIIVGTNFGYVRYFNLHGLCINIMKTIPIVSMITSSSGTLFMINQVSNDIYSYSIIEIHQDYKFIQQNVALPLKSSDNSEVPLIKGIFFNEYNDPCLVSGYDDSLMILYAWREPNNSKWIPILNCHHTVTENGSSNKKNWKCWPLGLYKDHLNCLILKNNNQYPGFPLPLPVEFEIKIPILVRTDKKKDILDELNDEVQTQADDPEENFLRALTMGKLVNNCLNEENHDEDNDDIMERLTRYSVLFDRSLLKLFGEACKESRLNKAFSIAKLIKTDKALMAATKISERMQFMNLATKIAKLREELVDLSEEEED